MVAGANDAGFLRLTITGWNATNRDTLETGIRASVSETFETSWTLFQMRIENEILCGRAPTTGVAANLFDEVYSTLGYSATHYPMPGRSFCLEARYRL